MKAKDLRNCYLAFAELYGAIFSDEAYEIIKMYFPELKKKELLSDLKDRNSKLTRGYQVLRANHGKYVITNEMYGDEELDILFTEQADKPFYVPDTYEELLSFINGAYWFEKQSDMLDELTRYLNKRCDKADVLSVIIFYHIRSGDLDMQNIMEIMDRMGVKFKSMEDVQKFLNLYMHIANRTKIPQNRGYSPEEMRKMNPIDPHKIQLTMGPNMREMFKNGEMNPEEYYDQLMKSDLPDSIKNSMGDELLSVMNQNKKHQA